MTEPSGPAWRQATFFPFSLTSRLATGSTLDVKLTSDVHETDLYGTVNTVDAVATHDRETGQTAAFLVNRSQSEEANVAIDISALGAVTLLDARTLADEDVHAKNTLADNERVSLRLNDSVRLGDGFMSVNLPPVSWTALSRLHRIIKRERACLSPDPRAPCGANTRMEVGDRHRRPIAAGGSVEGNTTREVPGEAARTLARQLSMPRSSIPSRPPRSASGWPPVPSSLAASVLDLPHHPGLRRQVRALLDLHADQISWTALLQGSTA